jgi:hypothetical protein
VLSCLFLVSLTVIIPVVVVGVILLITIILVVFGVAVRLKFIKWKKNQTIIADGRNSHFNT